MVSSCKYSCVILFRKISIKFYFTGIYPNTNVKNARGKNSRTNHLEDLHVNMVKKSFRFFLFDQCLIPLSKVSKGFGNDVSRKTQRRQNFLFLFK